MPKAQKEKLHIPEGCEGRDRGWCFTINNYTESDIRQVRALDYEYLVFGYEIAPKTGTPHLQGYVHFKNPQTFGYVHKRLVRARLTIADGNAQQNRKYCTEDGKFEEYGVMPQQGKRTDLEEVSRELIAGNTTVDQLVVANPVLYHQYGRTLHRLEDLRLRNQFRTWDCEGVWYYGETGTGKTHRAFNGVPPDPREVYLWNYDGGWQDGYVGQRTVILNEFRGQIPMSELLMLCDKWPATVRRRGREPAPFLASKIIVTSSMPPDGVYHNLFDDSIRQLLRRFTVIQCISHDEEKIVNQRAGGARRSEATDTQQGSEATASASPLRLQGSEATAQ